MSIALLISGDLGDNVRISISRALNTDDRFVIYV